MKRAFKREEITDRFRALWRFHVPSVLISWSNDRRNASANEDDLATMRDEETNLARVLGLPSGALAYVLVDASERIREAVETSEREAKRDKLNDEERWSLYGTKWSEIARPVLSDNVDAITRLIEGELLERRMRERLERARTRADER